MRMVVVERVVRRERWTRPGLWWHEVAVDTRINEVTFRSVTRIHTRLEPSRLVKPRSRVAATAVGMDAVVATTFMIIRVAAVTCGNRGATELVTLDFA